MRRFGKLWLVAPVLGVLAWLAAPSPVRADFIMILHEDGFTYTGPGAQNGNLVLTDSSNTGVISFNGSFGDFTAKTTAQGASNRLSPGDGSRSSLTISGNIFVDNSASGGQKTLTITLSDTGFTFPGGNTSVLSMRSSFGGTMLTTDTSDGTSFASYADANNGQGTTSGAGVTSAPLLSATSSGDTLGTDYSGHNDTNFTRNGAYSLTNVTTVSLTPSGANGATRNMRIGNETALVAPVPEPGSLALGLAGLVLAGVGAWARRKAGA